MKRLYVDQIKALAWMEVVGINPEDFKGQITPTQNALITVLVNFGIRAMAKAEEQ